MEAATRMTDPEAESNDDDEVDNNDADV